MNIDIIIETGLFEWLANKNFIYEDDKAAEKAYEEYENNHGEYPNGKEMVRENASFKFLRFYVAFTAVPCQRVVNLVYKAIQ